ncbi:CBS domain-containing protein [Myxococcota bacterium]|nr:CBS domain-containing protein [Myxococcota bacterium]
MNIAATSVSPEKLADQIPVSEVMTSDVVCVHPDLAIEVLIETMLDRGFSGAPVVDKEGRPVGIVSKTDLLRELHERGDTHEVDPARLRTKSGRQFAVRTGYHVSELSRATVGDVMMPVAFTLSESAPISQAAALMSFEGVHRVPVVSMAGTVVGIVSSLDILRWLAEQSGYLRGRADP